MILPNKYATLSQSYLGISAMILDVVSENKITIERLWDKFEKQYIFKKSFNHIPSYQKFLLTLDFMYLSKMINFNEEGEIYNENLEC